MKKSVGIGILLVLIIAGFFLFNNGLFRTSEDSSESIGLRESVGEEIPEQVGDNESLLKVSWGYNNIKWVSQGDPPSCPEPLVLQLPVDINLATSILYPGQIRGGDFKPHGGFRFDNSKREDIIVRAPLDGYIFRGGRSLQDGKLQYLFDFVNPCGIMYRFGHLYGLSPKLAAIAVTFPGPVEGDSRTTEIEPVQVLEGEIIGQGVGFEGNVFLDFGVYDLRQKNEASKNSEWSDKYRDSQGSYAVCWLDLLPDEDSAIVKALPGADGKLGKQSEYC